MDMDRISPPRPEIARSWQRMEAAGLSPAALVEPTPVDVDPGGALLRARFPPHFTPTSSSWLNLVERWFAELTNRKLRRSAHRSVTELEADVRRWINEWNANPKPFVWTKTADQILDTLGAYCQCIIDAR